MEKQIQSLSQDIESYILTLLEGVDDDFISLRRKELAEMFECVPSQINYVLRSRFSPEQGYLIESRRGEHGYIKIVKIKCRSSDEKISHVEDLVGNVISLRDARRLLETLQSREFITSRERLLIEIALRHVSEDFQDVQSNEIASLLKNMLGVILSE